MRTRGWTDEQVEIAIGRLLQTGVLLAAVVVFIGGVLFLVHSHGATANYSVFDPGREALHSIRPIFAGVVHLDGRSIIELGLLILIATPVVRVAFSIVAFWRQHDYVYVVVTCMVLATLCYSLFGWHG